MQLIVGCDANAHYNSAKIMCCNISGTGSAAVHALATCLAAPDVCLRMRAAAQAPRDSPCKKTCCSVLETCSILARDIHSRKGYYSYYEVKLYGTTEFQPTTVNPVCSDGADDSCGPLSGVPAPTNF